MSKAAALVWLHFNHRRQNVYQVTSIVNSNAIRTLSRTKLRPCFERSAEDGLIHFGYEVNVHSFEPPVDL